MEIKLSTEGTVLRAADSIELLDTSKAGRPGDHAIGSGPKIFQAAYIATSTLLSQPLIRTPSKSNQPMSEMSSCTPG